MSAETTETGSQVEEPQAEAETEAAEPQETEAQDPVRVHNRTRRSDHDALDGGEVIVEQGTDELLGDLTGRPGTFDKVEEYGDDGFPKTVIVSLHGVSGRLFCLPYEDIRAA